MKILLQDTGGYKLYAELVPVKITNQHKLKFTTTYDHAKDSTDEHNKLQLLLDDQAIAKLKSLIGDY